MYCSLFALGTAGRAVCIPLVCTYVSLYVIKLTVVLMVFVRGEA